MRSHRIHLGVISQEGIYHWYECKNYKLKIANAFPGGQCVNRLHQTTQWHQYDKMNIQKYTWIVLIIVHIIIGDWWIACNEQLMLITNTKVGAYAHPYGLVNLSKHYVITADYNKLTSAPVRTETGNGHFAEMSVTMIFGYIYFSNGQYFLWLVHWPFLWTGAAHAKSEFWGWPTLPYLDSPIAWPWYQFHSN